MADYKISKVLSNNVLLVQKEGQEYILVGKGIGFGAKRNEILKENQNVEKIFSPMNEENRDKYHQLLQHVPNEVIAVSEEIIAYASKQLDIPMNEHIHIALADHINFYILRQQEGIEIINPFMTEIVSLYPKEYVVARKGAELIFERLHVKIPEQEIGFLTLHILSGKMNQSVTEVLENTRLFHDIFSIIKKEAKIEIDSSSINYARMITHIRFLIERLKHNQGENVILIEGLRNRYTFEANIAKKIAKCIEDYLDMKMPEEEVDYIILHLYRVINHAKLNKS